jgi:excisionase family DNA binding protein
MRFKDPITTSEAASILGVTPRHVRHLAAIGQLESHLFGRVLYFSRTQVSNFEKKPVGRPAKAAS